MRTGIWSSRSRRSRRRRTRSTSPPGSSRTTSRGSKSARSRRSTSSRAGRTGDSRQNTLVQAQATVRTTELALKRLIVSGTDDPLWTSSINPVDRPSATPEPINLEAAVARALAEPHRPAAVEEQPEDQRHQSAEPGRRDQAATEPDGELRAERPWRSDSSSEPVPSTRSPAWPGTHDHSVGILRRAAEHRRIRCADLDASGSRSPIRSGQSAQEATVGRSKLSLQQTEVNMKALELQIATDVTNAALTVQSSLESVQASGGGARARAEAARGGAEQDGCRHGDQLRSRPGTARLRRRAQQRAARAS